MLLTVELKQIYYIEVKGRPDLNVNIEHLAMALLGDREELSNLELGWLDCVFGDKCENPCHYIYV